MQPTVRPIVPADIPNLILFLEPVYHYSEIHFTRLFGNPDLNSDDGRQHATGFLMESDGKIVGYIDSVPREIFWGQTRLLAAIRGSLFIEQGYREHLSTLLFAMLDQKEYDLFMVNSSNEHSGPVNKALRFKLGPSSCMKVRYRIFSYSKFILFGMKKSRRFQSVPKWMQYTASRILGSLWRTVKMFSPDRLPKENTRYASRRIEKITDNLFASFWNELLSGNKGILTSRRPEILRWTFQKRLESGRGVMLGRFDGDRLVGIITFSKTAAKNNRIRISDWIALKNDEAVLGDLLRDAILYLRSAKTPFVLQCTGFPESVQPILSRYLPYEHQKAPSFFYKIKNRKIIEDISDSWFFGPYDGDTAWL